jgi:hypothetical protein
MVPPSSISAEQGWSRKRKQGRRMKSPCQKRHRPLLTLSRTSVQHADPYQKGIKVTDAEMDSLSITRDDFHPEWNYTISPQTIDRAVIFA